MTTADPLDADYAADPATVIGGESIVIHKGWPAGTHMQNIPATTNAGGRNINHDSYLLRFESDQRPSDPH